MDDEARYCPFCGEKIRINAKKCKLCGRWLVDRDEESEDDTYVSQNMNTHNSGCFEYITNFIKLIIFIVAICLLGFYFYLSEEKPSCDSYAVKNLVVDIFKENNPYYIINKGGISDVILKNPIATSYDESLDKYYCKGTMIVRKYNNQEYNCNITYTAQKVKEGVYVETTACQGNFFNILRNFETQYEYTYEYEE